MKIKVGVVYYFLILECYLIVIFGEIFYKDKWFIICLEKISVIFLNKFN